MSTYQKLIEQKKLFMEVFWNVLNEAESNRILENSSAISIQRVFRGIVDRGIISSKGFKVNEIQRVFRGHLGRLISRKKKRSKIEFREISIFHYYCIQIQKCFRGYYSRKYKHDQHRRHQYTQMLIERNELIRESLQKYADELVMREQKEAEEKKDEDFKALAGNLHHLISTTRIPGVYKPVPYCNQLPTMKDLPVEEHIRGVVKDLLRIRGIEHRGLVEDLNGTKKIPLKGLKNRLSIQASAPYNALQEEQMRTNLIDRMVRKEKGSWIAGGKTNVINKDVVPLSTGNPYMDQWANPLLVKGVPKDTKELLESARLQKPLFVRHLEKPFYVRTEGNKSTTLPNDVFDVMAEATETGGAIQRHRGTSTSRFGLSANMDNRLDPSNTTIPKPPTRVSAIDANNLVRRTMNKMTLKIKHTASIRPQMALQTIPYELDHDSVSLDSSQITNIANTNNTYDRNKLTKYYDPDAGLSSSDDEL